MRKSPEAPGTMCRPPRHALRRRPGNVLVMFAVFLTGMIGMVAFAIDTGYIALYKTRMQRAADAGALAGAQEALVPPGATASADAVRAEVRKYIDLNMPGLTVRDEDIQLCRYSPYADPGARLSYTYTATDPANAVQVTLRRDSLQNSPLDLFFAPVIGSKNAAVVVTATAFCAQGQAVKPGASLLPYTMQIDYYYAAMGKTRPDGTGGILSDALNATRNLLSDITTVNLGLQQLTSGPDGVNEVVLFSDKQNAPGNFGSLDLGSTSNATGELERQILYGPTVADFANPDFALKVNQTDGALYVPFMCGGDTGLTSSVDVSFEAIKGQPRIIPLYDTVSGNGDNAVYNIVGYAGITVTKVDFQGSPKRLWIQPAFLVSNKVLPATNDIDVKVEGVYLPPKLVIP
ncbi:MAG TPA: pilus assembly protein TadG-related protein [Fimbriiglobus sp.]|nr:pilus assembly protein TadG-related protein [Fimbriiglobus sp.]